MMYYFFLSILASCESSSHELSMRVQNKDNFQHFPPPSSRLEINSVELPPKHSEHSKISHPSSSVAAFELQLNSVEKKTNGIHPTHGVNGITNGNTKTDKSHAGELLSPTKTPPPVLAKPKLWVILGHYIFMTNLYNSLSGARSLADKISRLLEDSKLDKLY